MRGFTKAICGAGLALASFHPQGLDLGGDLHHTRSPEEIEQVIEADKARMYADADIMGRYSLLLLQDKTNQDTVIAGHVEGGNGIIGKLHGMVHAYWTPNVHSLVGQGCLEHSMYDTENEIRERVDGGHLREPELTVEGDVVVIIPAYYDQPPLRFTQGDSRWFPVDLTTVQALDNRGCEPSDISM